MDTGRKKRITRLFAFFIAAALTAVCFALQVTAADSAATFGRSALNEYTRSAIERGLSGADAPADDGGEAKAPVGTPVEVANPEEIDAGKIIGEIGNPLDSETAEDAMAVEDEKPLLSNAVAVIQNKMKYKKAAVVGSDITFTAEEFEKFLGVKKLGGLVITKLPPVGEGVLVLGRSDVIAGQTIKRDNIKYMRIVPYPGRQGTIEFTFKNSASGGGGGIICSVSVLDALNFAPSADSGKYQTQKGIALVKPLAGSDPDSDALSFRVIKAPEKGILQISDDGIFTYMPKSGFTGSDNFVYAAEDIYGNRSGDALIQIKVTKAASDVNFTDLANHWANNSAVRAYAAGIMQAAADGSEAKFEPNLLVSRAEFLEMVMKASGLDKNLEEVFETGFSDDEEIPLKYKPYVKRARELGIITGVEHGSSVCFEPNVTISRAEAAVMINNILKISTTPVTKITASAKYVDAISIPSWAEDDIYALSTKGIFKGDGRGNMDPDGLLDRAQSAELMCSVSDYKKSTSKFNFFGLFE